MKNVKLFTLFPRYGLPVNFQAMLVKPTKKNTKRLKETLNQLYGHLDSTALSSQQVEFMELLWFFFYFSLCNILHNIVHHWEKLGMARQTRLFPV